MDSRPAKRAKLKESATDLPHKKSQAFRLFDLPVELRCTIYEYALGGYKTRNMFLDVIHGDVYNETRSDRPAMCRPAPELLLVNKEVYGEVVEIFHQMITASVTINTEWSWIDGARPISKATTCRVLRGIHTLDLKLVLHQDYMAYLPYDLSELVTGLGRTRKLRNVDVLIDYDWGFQRLLDATEIRPIFMALGGMACEEIDVSWTEKAPCVCCDKPSSFPMWVPHEFRAMGGELEEIVKW